MLGFLHHDGNVFIGLIYSKKSCWVLSQGWVPHGKNIVSTVHGYISMLLLFPLHFQFKFSVLLFYDNGGMKFCFGILRK